MRKPLWICVKDRSPLINSMGKDRIYLKGRISNMKNVPTASTLRGMYSPERIDTKFTYKARIPIICFRKKASRAKILPSKKLITNPINKEIMKKIVRLGVNVYCKRSPSTKYPTIINGKIMLMRNVLIARLIPNISER